MSKLKELDDLIVEETLNKEDMKDIDEISKFNFGLPLKNINLLNDKLKLILKDIHKNVKHIAKRYVSSIDNSKLEDNKHDKYFGMFLKKPNEMTKNKYIDFCNEFDIKVDVDVLDNYITLEKAKESVKTFNGALDKMCVSILDSKHQKELLDKEKDLNVNNTNVNNNKPRRINKLFVRS